MKHHLDISTDIAARFRSVNTQTCRQATAMTINREPANGAPGYGFLLPLVSEVMT